MGGKRVSFDLSAQEFDTGAQFVDEGPGSGDSKYKFPANGETISFNKTYFESIGFPNIIEGWECTGVDNMEDNDASPYSYDIFLSSILDTPRSNENDPDKLKVSNPSKN